MFHKEGEKSAMKKSLILSLVVLIIGFSIYQFHLEIILYLIAVFVVLLIVVLIYPFITDPNFTDDFPSEKHDERDIMFSRKELIPGSENYKTYYTRYPEKEILDNEFRKQPGLLSPKSAYFHKEAFHQADISFNEVNKLYQFIYGKINRQKASFSASEFTGTLKIRAKELGALDVGITMTKPYHFYSHKGRGIEYGNKIENKHRYAIAFTVEMDHEMVMAAPQASIVMESAKQYLKRREDCYSAGRTDQEHGIRCSSAY